MTGLHEIFQSAPQIAHQAKELIDLEMRSNLLQKLIESGHPYGLLLSQSNASSTNGSSESLINFFFPIKKGEAKAVFWNSEGNKEKGSRASSTILFPPSGIKYLFLLETSLLPLYAVSSLNSSFLSSIEPLTRRIPIPIIRKISKLEDIGHNENKGDWSAERSVLSGTYSGNGSIFTLFSKSSILESAKKDGNIAQKLHLEQLFNQQAFLAPIWLKLFAKEIPLQERTRELFVGQQGVGLGTAAVKLATFRGQEPFTIKSPKGEEIVQVNPGDPIGHIHLSHQAGQLRHFSPMEKVSIMIEDLRDLFSVIDQPIEAELKPQQQETIIKARSATIIGISHLVRLFSRKTGLPTWKLDVLPELVQRFHQHDSQAVSRAFGGSRKVKPSDVEMMVLTPEMRRQLVAVQG